MTLSRLRLAAVLALTVTVLVLPGPADAGYQISCYTRADAYWYLSTAQNRGYEWGGGWWNNNNYDDTPGCPDCGSAYEGPDCSGLTFKTWAMSQTWGVNAQWYWDIGENVHGPYTAMSFRDGCGGACYDVCGSGTGTACGSSSYASTQYLDAFAKSNHIGIIYSEGSSGYDYIMEAYSDAAGTNLFSRNYRMQATYDGVRRYGWSTSPPCPS